MLVTNNEALHEEISTLFKEPDINAEKLSEFLSNYIINNHDKIKIDKFIKENLIDYIHRKKEIYNKVDSYFNRKASLEKIINKYLKHYNRLNVEGFIAFRLKEYRETLNQVLEDIYDDLTIEDEYENFIYLIKELIQTGIPVIETMHILIDNTGKYKIFSNHKNEITKKCMEEFKEEIEFGIINYDDFLISTLINYCPKTIVVHNYKNFLNKEIKTTIEKVYGNNLIICSGCEFCK